MKKKKCFKCGKEKFLKNFYKHPQMADGRLNKCIDCTKKDVNENRKDKIDYYLEYDKKRCNLPHRVKAREEYHKNNPEKISKYKREWIKRNSEKRKAHNIVNGAIRGNKLIKSKSCCKCGKETNKLNAHHKDYSKPLEVEWMCVSCHNKWHKDLRAKIPQA